MSHYLVANNFNPPVTPMWSYQASRDKLGQSAAFSRYMKYVKVEVVNNALAPEEIINFIIVTIITAFISSFILYPSLQG